MSAGASDGPCEHPSGVLSPLLRAQAAGQVHRAAIVHCCLCASYLPDSPLGAQGVTWCCLSDSAFYKGISPLSPPGEKQFTESKPEPGPWAFGQRSKENSLCFKSPSLHLLCLNSRTI